MLQRWVVQGVGLQRGVQRTTCQPCNKQFGRQIRLICLWWNKKGIQTQIHWAKRIDTDDGWIKQARLSRSVWSASTGMFTSSKLNIMVQQPHTKHYQTPKHRFIIDITLWTNTRSCECRPAWHFRGWPKTSPCQYRIGHLWSMVPESSTLGFPCFINLGMRFITHQLGRWQIWA